MRIAKYPFAVLSAALFTVMLVTPITSISNLIWLSSFDMPVTILSSLEVILFDFQRLGVALLDLGKFRGASELLNHTASATYTV